MNPTLGRISDLIWGNQFATRIDYDGNQRQTYIGYTLPEFQHLDGGVWGIMLIYYVGATMLIDRICYAEGNSRMTKTWSLRATYTY